MYAGQAITTGSHNDLIGYAAGKDITTGSHNIAIGNTAGTGLTGQVNTICIGSGATVTGGDMCRIGNDNIKVGIRNSSPAVELDVTGNIRTSDGLLANSIKSSMHSTTMYLNNAENYNINLSIVIIQIPRDLSECCKIQYTSTNSVSYTHLTLPTILLV